jgi:hypothetical protein
MNMRKLVTLSGLIGLLAVLAACSGAPVKYGSNSNSAEQQRQHAKEAQDELSTDINRGSK